MKKIYIVFLVFFLLVIVFTFFPTPTYHIRELYKGSDNTRIALLDSVRAIPLKSINIDDADWNYLAAGEGNKTILLLHGMVGSYDIWWQQILALKDSFRIISVTYPPVTSLKDMGEAVIKIMDNEGVGQSHVIGSSLGGYLAQYLKTTYPDRIDRAIFSNTFPPNRIFEAENAATAATAAYLPEWLVMYLFRSNLRTNVLPASENSPLAEAYLLEQSYGRMSKEQFLARFQCLVDSFTPAPSLSTSKDILIIESDNDPLVFPELREQMKAIYPAASVFTFHDKGHFPYLNETVQYNSLVREFLGKP